MASIKDVVIKIKGDNSDFKRKMKDSGDVAETQSKRMAKAFGLLKNPLAIVAATLTAITTKGIKDFAIAERATLRLESVLKATGNAAGLTAEEIGLMADRLEATTFFSAEQVQDAASILATFKSITGDVFTDTIGLSADMAEVFGTDLKSSVTQLGKALEDPINGLTALRRVGVSFSDQQKEVIQGFVDTNQLAEAQGVILDVLSEQIGGAAAGGAGGLGGAFNNMGDALGMITENFGAAVAETIHLEEAVGGLTSAVNWLNDALFVSDADQAIRDRAQAMDEWVKKSKDLGMVFSIKPSSAPVAPRARSGQSGTSATARVNKELSAQKAILEAIKTPQQEYADKISVAESLLANNMLTLEQFNIYQEKLKEGFDDVGEAAEVNARLIQDKFGDALESAAFDFDNFGDSARGVLEGLARDLARRNIIDPFTSGISDAISGGGGGDILSGIGGLFSGSGFGGFFADGGRPPVGKVSVVGERGPELFVPNAAGTIIPNGAMGGGNVTVNVVNNTQSQVGVSRGRSSNGTSIEVQIDELTAQNILTQGSRTNSALGAVSGSNVPRR